MYFPKFWTDPYYISSCPIPESILSQVLRRYLVNILSEDFFCSLWLYVGLIRYQLWGKLGITRQKTNCKMLTFNALAHTLVK